MNKKDRLAEVYRTTIHTSIGDALARYIGVTVFKNSGDIRDVISIGKLVKKSDGPNDVDTIIKTLMKYGPRGKEE